MSLHVYRLDLFYGEICVQTTSQLVVEILKSNKALLMTTEVCRLSYRRD